MGKTYLCRKVLVEEFGAGHVNIDDLYSSAVAKAGMAEASDNQLAPGLVKARRMARDRKWSGSAARRKFFAAYAERVSDALAESSFVVFDGGSLRKDDEVNIIVKAAGAASPIVRVCVEATYPRWLQNRVIQAAERKKEFLIVKNVTPDGFARARKKSRPSAHSSVIDHRVADANELRLLVRRCRPSLKKHS